MGFIGRHLRQRVCRSEWSGACWAGIQVLDSFLSEAHTLLENMRFPAGLVFGMQLDTQKSEVTVKVWSSTDNKNPRIHHRIHRQQSQNDKIVIFIVLVCKYSDVYSDLQGKRHCKCYIPVISARFYHFFFCLICRPLLHPFINSRTTGLKPIYSKGTSKVRSTVKGLCRVTATNRFYNINTDTIGIIKRNSRLLGAKWRPFWQRNLRHVLGKSPVHQELNNPICLFSRIKKQGLFQDYSLMKRWL